MKKLVLLFILLLPLVSKTQTVIMLSVNQPPEFGFSVSKQDTTIVKGRSVILGTDLVVFGGSGEYQYSWSPATTLDDSTAINPLASPIDTTTYLLTVSDKFGCSFSVNYTVNTRNPLVNSDLISSRQNLQATLFPNPNNGKFKVKLTGVPADKIELTIIDNTGKVVKRQIMSNFTGDQTELIHLKLTSGIYTLSINSGIENVYRQFIIN